MSAPTQVAHPWQATVRTVFALIVALCTLIPVVVFTAGIGAVPAVAQVVGVATAITRVLAMPEVDQFLSTFVPWLSATGKG